MVTTPIDPIRVPVITLSQSEIDEIQDEIAAGRLPADFLERCDAARERNVFGFDHKKDRQGNPIEQGRGSAQNQTHQSVEAYRKWGRDEPDYERNLSRMEKELVACEAQRKAKAGGRRGASRR